MPQTQCRSDCIALDCTVAPRLPHPLTIVFAVSLELHAGNYCSSPRSSCSGSGSGSGAGALSLSLSLSLSNQNGKIVFATARISPGAYNMSSAQGGKARLSAMNKRFLYS